MAKRSWLGALFLRASLLAAAVVVALGLVDVMVRATGNDRPLVWQPHPELGWWHIPHAEMHWLDEGDGRVRINGQGLRDVERSVDKAAGVMRIAIFGDSMTEGVQVNLDQTFSQLLEQNLRARGLQVEVLNFGVNGYSPLQSFLLYQRVGRTYRPDLVLHAVFLDNDVADGSQKLATGQAGAPFPVPSDDGLVVDFSLADASSRDYRQEPIFSLRRWSATYRWLSFMRWNRTNRRAAQDAASAEGDVPRRYLLYEPSAPAEWSTAWSTLETILTEFSQEVQADGAPFAVVSVPAGQVVNRDAWARVVEDFPAMASRQWDLLGPEQRLGELASRRGLTLLAPLEAFQQATGSEPLFFGNVGHLTPAGHRVMAATLEQLLATHGLIPPVRP